MKYQKLLAKSKLASLVPNENLNLLKTIVVPKYEFLYKDCDYSNVMFLLSGSVVFCHNQLDKHIFLPSTSKKGDFLGDHLADNKYKSYTDYYTIEETIVVYIPRPTMEVWKDKYPKLLKYLYSSATERNFIINLYQYIRYHKGLMAALAFVIDNYAKENIFSFKSITALALKFNTTRKNLHYAIKKLEEDGVIEKTKRGQIIILDRDLLTKTYEDEVFDF